VAAAFRRTAEGGDRVGTGAYRQTVRVGYVDESTQFIKKRSIHTGLYVN
jgi:hypothetical protein